VPKASTTVSRDPGDTKFLQCAETAKADYIVTGNKRHFPEARAISAPDLMSQLSPAFKPCRTSLEMFSTLYDFCRDQGSIIGGLLALAAGYLVFRGTTRTADRQVAAANAQTEALRQRNRDLRNEGQRRQARDGIVATKLLASVLGVT
jgi:hypothetical protein